MAFDNNNTVEGHIRRSESSSATEATGTLHDREDASHIAEENISRVGNDLHQIQSSIPESKNLPEQAEEINVLPLALGEMLMDLYPESPEEHRTNMQNMLGEFVAAKKSAEVGKEDSAEKIDIMISALEQALAEQQGVDECLAGDNGRRFGCVFAFPGFGIIGTELYQYAYQQPTLSLEAFREQTAKLATALPKDLLEKQEELRTRLTSELQEQVARLTARIQGGKRQIETLYENRKSTGWMGGFHRWLTHSDPYALQIDNERKEVSSFQDNLLPLLRSASEDLEGMKPMLHAAQEKIAGVLRGRASLNYNNQSRSQMNVELEAADVTQQAVIDGSLAVVPVGAVAKIGGRLAAPVFSAVRSQVTKQMVKTTAMLGATTGAVTASIAMQMEMLHKDEPGTTPENIGDPLQELTKEEADLIAETYIMKTVPQGEYQYSDTLTEMLEANTKALSERLFSIKNLPEEERIEAEKGFLTMAQDKAFESRAQFIRDNLDPHDAETRVRVESIERKPAIFDAKFLKSELQMIASLAHGDKAAALDTAMQYVRSSYFGLQETDVPTAASEALIRTMAEDMLHKTESIAYPAFVAAVQVYAEQGMERVFKARVHATRVWAENVIKHPIKEGAAIAAHIGVAAHIVSETGVMELLEVGTAAANAVGSVALSKTDIIALLQTLAGEAAFANMIGGAGGVARSALKVIGAGTLTKVGAETTFRSIKQLKLWRARVHVK